jgi:hypothetical protein
MNHEEVRFMILKYLYEKHYGGERLRPQRVDLVISESDLKNINKDFIYGEIVYLHNGGFIDDAGGWPLGYDYPPWIRITNLGIDFVTNVLDSAINATTMEGAELGDSIKEEINNISKESDPPTKLSRFWNYAKSQPMFFSNIVEKILKEAFRTGILGT